jgi:hypothetical protein
MSQLSIDTLLYGGAILIAITLICVLLFSNCERYYTSLRHIGKFSPHVNNLVYPKHDDDDDEPQSLKFRGHRYERKRVRGIKQYAPV